MGFQFNHVGGGTKTRRPITLHMKYNSACVQPNCYLLTEDFGEQEVSLEELQVRSLAVFISGKQHAAQRYGLAQIISYISLDMQDEAIVVERWLPMQCRKCVCKHIAKLRVPHILRSQLLYTMHYSDNSILILSLALWRCSKQSSY